MEAALSHTPTDWEGDKNLAWLTMIQPTAAGQEGKEPGLENDSAG